MFSGLLVLAKSHAFSMILLLEMSYHSTLIAHISHESSIIFIPFPVPLGRQNLYKLPSLSTCRLQRSLTDGLQVKKENYSCPHK